MKPLAEDTRPEVEALHVELMRALTPAEKMARMVSLNRSLRAIARAAARRAHPEATEREVALRAASRWLPADLMRKAFGWDPHVEGY